MAVAVALALASPAAADHHLIKIREYYPGTLAQANDGFLELQMYASDQNLVSGQEIHVYDSTGTAPEPSVFQLNPSAPDPANGDNQRTILIAGTSGPSDRDYPENLDTEYDPAGGGLCFVSTEGFGEIDCLEWGSGSDVIDAGSPAAASGIPDGQSLTRTIAPGCATLLEASDDTDDSATDFALTAPSPRNNATAPTEMPCAPGGGGGRRHRSARDDDRPGSEEEDREAQGEVPLQFLGGRLELSVQARPQAVQALRLPLPQEGEGRQEAQFRVRAIDAAGNVDPTPAKRKWKVRR